MRKVIYYLSIAILTFLIGLAGVAFYNDYQARQKELGQREVMLYRNLYELRRSIDDYAADTGKLPQSLRDLVRAKYLREVPLDPITNKRDWKVVVGNDSISIEGNQGVVGIIDVRSTSSDISSHGTAYSDW